MIALYLLAAHLTGDFLFQTRWQAAVKLEDWTVRLTHVSVYAIPFIPIVAVYGQPNAFWFLLLLGAAHFATDSFRFHSSLGETIQWQVDRVRAPASVRKAWIDHLYGPDDLPGEMPRIRPGDVERRQARARGVMGRTLWFPPPNPWPFTSLVIDQSLHVIQLAILGGLFLR